jgi:hypothetical protein
MPSGTSSSGPAILGAQERKRAEDRTRSFRTASSMACRDPRACGPCGLDRAGIGLRHQRHVSRSCPTTANSYIHSPASIVRPFPLSETMFGALNRFISRLDAEPQEQKNSLHNASGFQVLKNTNTELSIEPWFDFIIGINGRTIVRQDLLELLADFSSAHRV